VSDVDGEDNDDDDMLPKGVSKTCAFTHAFFIKYAKIIIIKKSIFFRKRLYAALQVSHFF
jgi:hypothetical protein